MRCTARKPDAKRLSFDNIPRIRTSRFVHAQHRSFLLPMRAQNASSFEHTTSSQRLSTGCAMAFQAKWIPVRAKKMRQTIIRSFAPDSIRSQSALSVWRAKEVAPIALLRLGVQLVPQRIDQSLIVCADPEVSIPCDRTNFCWTRRIVLFERSELLTMPGRNEKFHRKAPLGQFIG